MIWSMALRGMLVMSCGVAVLDAGAAQAGVIEIGDDGAVSERNDGGAVHWVARNAGAGNSAGAHVANVPLADRMAMVPPAWRPLLEASATRYNVSPYLLAALVWQESRWHPLAVSPKGAVGLGQLMPGTARDLAVDPRDPGANLDGAARYLRRMLDMFGGDIDRALAAYNAGAARVIRAGGIPPIAETQAYVAHILDRVAATSEAGTEK